MQFEALYQELVHSTEMIRALLNGISQENARIKPDRESWSILEVICHLYDEEREDFREHLDFILHRQNENWHIIDPEGWVGKRAYNEQNIEEMKDKFFEERKISVTWLNEHNKMDLGIKYKSKWDNLAAGDMFAAWVAHDNLHIRQLVELRRLGIERIAKPYAIEYAGEW